MLILSNEDIESILTMSACMRVMEELYVDFGRDQALFFPRSDNILPSDHVGAYYGFKTMGGGWPRYSIMALRVNSDIITHPSINGRRRRVKIPQADGRWVGLVYLFSTETGELLSIFPDGVCQRMRVGATNGLALKYLARADARKAGLIGTGWQAGAQLQALLTSRPIDQVKVYSPTKANREAFVEEMRLKTDVKITSVDSPEMCAADVDILMTATSSLDRVIEPQWLTPGMHVSCIKSQEIDPTVFACCDRIVTHTKVQAKQAANILPGTRHIPQSDRAGWWRNETTAPHNFPDLADLVTGNCAGRQSEQEITCFINNIGLGLQFAAVGALILNKAKELGIGTELPSDWFTESVHP